MKNKNDYGGFDNFKWVLYPLVLGVLVIYSVFQVGLDPTIIWTQTFWLKLFFKYLLQFAWIYFGIPDGKGQGSTRDGFVQSSQNLKRAVTLLKDKGLLLHFKEYVKHDNKKRREQFIDDALFSNGIDKKLFEKDLKDLRKNKDLYDLDNGQLNVIERLKRGKFFVSQIQHNDVVSVYAIKSVGTDGHYNEGLDIFRQMLPKIALTFVTMVISSSIAIVGEVGVGQAIYDTTFNVAISIASYGFAFRSGQNIMEHYRGVFEYRANYIASFIEQYENGKFVPDLAVYTVAEVKK
jgi:hypothetical protein